MKDTDLVIHCRHPVLNDFLPPDVAQPDLRIREIPKPSLVLDIDHSKELNGPFEIERIEDAFHRFQDVSDRVILALVTREALFEWGLMEALANQHLTPEEIADRLAEWKLNNYHG